MGRRARVGGVVVALIASAWVMWALLSSDDRGGAGQLTAPLVDDAPMMELDASDRADGVQPLLPDDAAVDTPDVTATHGAAVEDPVPRGTGDVIVEVFFADGRPAPDIGLAVMVWGPGGSGSGKPRRGVTDALGEARFPGLRRGTVVAYGDRSGSTSGELQPGEELRLRLDLDAGHLLHGWVVDAAGRPVAGAGIWLSSYFNSDSGMVVTHSDEDGAFRVEAVGLDRFVGAALPPLMPSPLRLLTEPEHFADPLTLQLGERGATLIVDMRLVNGDPHPDVTLIVGGEHGWSAPQGDDAHSEGPPPREARSDADGRAVFEGLPPGRTQVLARADGFGPGSRSVTLSLDEPLTVTLGLPPGCVLRGRVLDDVGAPVAGATLVTGEWGSFLGRTTETDSDGRYVLDDLLPGEVGLSVNHPECLPASTLLTLGPDAPARWDPVLERGLVIDGHVTDRETGLPMDAMFVAAIPPGGELLFRGSARSESDGSFRLTGLEDARYDVVALHLTEAGFVEAARIGDVLPGATVSLRAEPVREPGGVLGQLLDDLSQPPQDAWFKLVPVDGSAREQGVRVEPDGSFELPRVNPGRYTAVALVHEPVGLPPLGAIDVRAGETTDLGVLRLIPGGRVRVRLHPQDGVDLTEVALWLRGADRWSQGKLTLEGLDATGSAAAGLYDLVCRGTGVAAQRMPVTLESGLETVVDLDVGLGVAQPVLLRARPGQKMIDIGYQVRDELGRLVVDAPASRYGAESLSRTLHLAPGAYVLHVSQHGRARSPRPFEVGVEPGPALVIEMH